MELDLNHNWRFTQIAYNTLNSSFNTFLPASVPGNVHMDLWRNDLIEDPFYRTNEASLQWIERESWEYKTVIEAGEVLLSYDNIDLILEGLDTYASVYLNDTLILEADNMFVSWEIPCKSLFKMGENELRICFHSPITKTLPKYEALGYELPAGNDQSDIRVSVFTRKAPYHYGWDWGPRFVTSGIWKPVKLKVWNRAKIKDLHIVQNSLKDEMAELTAFFEVEASQATEARITIKSQDLAFYDQSITVQLAPGIQQIALDFSIKNPVKWWPNGLGEANLYPIEGAMEIKGVDTDKKALKVGLRTVEVINEPDAEGESFYLKVNGIPVFMKGANYIPADNFLNRVDEKRYKALLQSAVDANMNMLRVWGGGIYEHDRFYELADEFGLLIWQDFMFSCSMYPGDEEFLNRVRQEAASNIKRLRNHPCLALWCGNNEMKVAWENWGWQQEFGYSPEVSNQIWSDYQKIFEDILPDAVKELDGERFYFSSSPISNWEKAEDFKKGDNHFWGVWHGSEPFESFKEKIPRFMSEYGFQSFPEFKTVKQYALPEDWDIYSEVMLAHQRHPRGNQLINEYMQRSYQDPKDFESFLYVGQVMQAEGMKIAFEAHRRAKPYCMGSLYWQLNDCWPVASWSGIDYYGRWKALHYFAKKAFSPVLVSPVVEDEKLKIYIVSDRLVPIEADLKMKILDFAGEEYGVTEFPVCIKANASGVYHTESVNKCFAGLNKDALLLHVTLFQNASVISENVLYFVPPKNLDLPRPGLRKAVFKTPDGYRITLESDYLAKNLHLCFPRYEGLFSDNYFDLLPGEQKTVLFKTDAAITETTSDLQLTSLVDSYHETKLKEQVMR